MNKTAGSRQYAPQVEEMHQQIEIVLQPELAASEEEQKRYAAQLLHIQKTDITSVAILKRSIDARSRNIKVRMQAEVFWGEAACT